MGEFRQGRKGRFIRDIANLIETSFINIWQLEIFFVPSNTSGRVKWNIFLLTRQIFDCDANIFLQLWNERNIGSLNTESSLELSLWRRRQKYFNKWKSFATDLWGEEASCCRGGCHGMVGWLVRAELILPEYLYCRRQTLCCTRLRLYSDRLTLYTWCNKPASQCVYTNIKKYWLKYNGGVFRVSRITLQNTYTQEPVTLSNVMIAS